MEEVRAADYEYIKKDLIKGNDEVIISGYLKNMIVYGDSWSYHFIENVDVFNKDPREVFDSLNPNLAIFTSRTESCGKTDGCESGCWRVMGRDKLITTMEDYEDDKIELRGFKRILKFCEKRKQREYDRNWVMEEYRLAKRWNWKQDYVICKIRHLLKTEISLLLSQHFLYLYTNSSYLNTIMATEGNHWPSYFNLTNNVYRVDPLKLVDPQDQRFIDNGICIFANRTDSCDRTDGCDSGCWRIMDRDRLVKSETGEILGFKRVFKFCEKVKRRYVCEGEAVKVTWTMEEYRPAETVKQDKVLCVIKLMWPIPLNSLLRR